MFQTYSTEEVCNRDFENDRKKLKLDMKFFRAVKGKKKQNKKNEKTC